MRNTKKLTLPLRFSGQTSSFCFRGDLRVNHLIPWAESVQLYGRFSLSFSSFTFLLKHSQSQSKALLYGKDAFALAHMIVQIPPIELNDLQRQRTDQIDAFTTETSCLTIVWAVMQDMCAVERGLCIPDSIGRNLEGGTWIIQLT